MALQGHPSDGHNVKGALRQIKRINGTQPEILIANEEETWGERILVRPSFYPLLFLILAIRNIKKVNKHKDSEKSRH